MARPTQTSPRLFRRRSNRFRQELVPRVVIVTVMTLFVIALSVRLLQNETNLIVLVDSGNQLLLDQKAKSERKSTTDEATTSKESTEPPNPADAELPEPEQEPPRKDAEEKPSDDPNDGDKISKLSRKEQYELFEADIGILSEASFDTYLERHKEIDSTDKAIRCRRYSYTYTASNERDRRIFYGAIIMDEPWEMFEILSAEWYGALHSMVFIEPTRDYYGEPRKPLRLDAVPVLKSMFGIEDIRVVKFENDDPNVKGDLYLDMARNQILKEWIDMGMTKDDVAYMGNIDEMFARDFLMAIRYCEVPDFKYEIHKCVYNRVKTFGHCQVYEVSPECVSRTKVYDHPDVMIGACMEGIGDPEINQLAPRDETGVNRAKGWNCEDRDVEKDIKDQTYPLWSGADLYSLCGGKQVRLRASLHQSYASFHFRNWFNTARDMRLKHTTADKLYEKSMDDLGEDMRVTYRCLKDIPDEEKAVTKREPGGFSVLKPMTPIYLADETYRKKVHERATKKILEDEKLVKDTSTEKTATKKK